MRYNKFYLFSVLKAWRRRLHWTSAGFFLAALLAACAPVEPSPAPTLGPQVVQPSSTPIPAEPAVIPTTFEPPAAATPATEGTRTLRVVGTPLLEETMPADLNPYPVPGDAYTSGLVDMAVKDLAGRLKTQVDQIVVVAFEPIVWPDGALGCPEPDKMYIQVQVEGYRIRLLHNGVTYSYHGGSDRPPFLCEQPG